VQHAEYRNLDEPWFINLLSDKGILVDLKGIYRGKISKLAYWSL